MMGAEHIIGDYHRLRPKRLADVEAAMEPENAPLDWQEADRLASFLADYLGALAEAKGLPDNGEPIASLGYAANELCENAIKYSAQSGLCLRAWLQSDGLALELDNTIDEALASSLDKAASEIQDNDPHMLFMQRVEDNAEGLESGSGLGFLTLIIDHDAEIGWRLEPGAQGLVQLHTVVWLPAIHEE